MKYLTKDSGPDQSLRGLLLLLEGISLHAISVDDGDCGRFRDDMARLAKSLSESNSPDNLMLTIGAVHKTMEEYNRRVLQTCQMKQVNLHEIISLRSHTIADMAKGNQTAASELQGIEKQIERAAGPEDFAVVKSSLAASLRNIRAGCERQREGCVQLLNEMKTKLEQTRISASPGEPSMSPSRQTAEKAIREALAKDGKGGLTYVAALTMESFRAIVGRYGAEAGSQVSLFFTKTVRAGLQPFDLLLAYETGSYVLVMKRSGTAEMVKQEIARFVRPRLEVEIRHENRALLVPVQIASCLHLTTDASNTDGLLRQIEEFMVNRPGSRR